MRISDWSSDVCSSDLLLQAVDQVGIAVFVHGADVAGMEPAVAQRRRGLRRLLPIARHDLRPAQADLALLAPRNRRATAVERAVDDLGARQRTAVGAPPAFSGEGLDGGGSEAGRVGQGWVRSCRAGWWG